MYKNKFYFMIFLLEERAEYTLKCIAFITLLFSLPAFSQKITESVNEIHYKVNDGLPSTETYDVFQDSKGFLWVGTDKGVARFDGNKFETFTINDGLTDNLIFRFIEDEQHRIWLITYNRKLCFFENERFHTYKYNDFILNSLKDLHSGVTITDIKVAPDDELTLNLLDYTQLTIDKKGNTVRSRSPYYHKIQKVTKSPYREKETLKVMDTIFTSLFEGKKLPVSFEDYYVSDFYKVGDYLIKTGYKGVAFFNTKTKKIEKRILENYFVTGMTIDFEGGYWFSTLNSGILYISDPNVTYYSTENLTSKPAIVSILPQNEKLIFSFRLQDYLHYQKHPKKKELTPFQENLFAFKIPYQLRKTGIKFENPASLVPFSQPMRAILQVDTNHILYASNYGGLVDCKKTVTDSWKEKTIPGPKINKIIKDFNGKIWLATHDGIYFYNKTNHSLAKDTSHSLINSQRVQDIVVTEDHSLIIATHTNGILTFKNDSFKHYSQDNGLISNYINNLNYDPKSGLLWVATNRGICNMHYKGGQLHQPKAGSKMISSITSIDVRLIFKTDTALYFISNEGIFHVNSKQLNKYEVKPKIYLQHISVNDRQLYSLENSILNFNQNNLSLTVRGISFNSLRNLKYEFKLEGLHKNYRISESSNFDFFALSPGDYNFQISAINKEGIRSSPLNVSFSISPPFWLKWWFKLSIVLIGASLLYLYLREIIKRYEVKAQLEVDFLRLKSMNLQSKMNPHFIFNSLNSIQHYIISNKPDKANDYLVDFSKLARKVLTNSDSPEISLKDELQTIDMYVNLELRRMRSSFHFRKEIDTELQQNKCLIPALLIQPYIENSIWHGKLNTIENALIVLRIYLIKNRLYIEIEDNGVGYSNTIKYKKNNSSSYGIGVTKERLRLMEKLNTQLSEVIVGDAENLKCSGENSGTLVQFNIPYTLQA